MIFPSLSDTKNVKTKFGEKTGKFARSSNKTLVNWVMKAKILSKRTVKQKVLDLSASLEANKIRGKKLSPSIFFSAKRNAEVLGHRGLDHGSLFRHGKGGKGRVGIGFGLVLTSCNRKTLLTF